METVMGVPSRFATEYPDRALKLIRLFEDTARSRDYLGSFGLLAAAAVLTIPYERMHASHFLHRPEKDGDLAQQIKDLKKVKFFEAPFWRDQKPGPTDWRQSRIMAHVEDVDTWRDDEGRASLSAAANSIQKRKAGEVIRILRNALAHGNIIYLDRDDRELAGNQMVSMAFLSRYEETEEQQGKAETYRVVVTSEEEFLRFVKAWARWVSGFALDHTVSSTPPLAA